MRTKAVLDLNQLPQLSRTVRVPLKDFARFEKALGKAIVDQVFKKAVPEAAVAIRDLLEQKTLDKGIKFKGRYARGWKIQRAEQAGAVVRISNKMPYGLVIEKGRRPNRRPPPSDVLVPWIMEKFGLTRKEAKRIAFVVARSIGRKGIRARPVLGLKTVQAQIQRILKNTATLKLQEALNAAR